MLNFLFSAGTFLACLPRIDSQGNTIKVNHARICDLKYSSMNQTKFLFTFIILFTCCTFNSYSQDFDSKKFEQEIQKGIAKAYAASVKIWGIDSTTQKQNSAQFSGVLVDIDGHILTAAHAISPNKIYKVTLTDGRTFLAKGLGKMGFEPKTGRPDAAMIKITDQGNWPVAELGWSQSLKINQPCISIAYPTTLNQVLPTVRVGRISDPKDRWGFIISTCKMEPGDSGGPLFDYMGRVIGIHSRIDISEDVNYEIPVDTYRKYWSALTNAIDYSSFPETSKEISMDPKQSSLKSFSALENLKNVFALIAGKLKANSLSIQSVVKGRNQSVVGTLFYLDRKIESGKKDNKSYIVSKSSMVGDSVVVLLAGQRLPAKVVARNNEYDLVLLHLKDEIKDGIKISSLNVQKTFVQNDLGEFLISVLPDSNAEVSVLSSNLFDLPKKFSTGYFGASANFINEKIILTRINPNSPAEKSGLLLQDQITGINNIPISQPPQYGSELMKYEPGDTISIQGIRSGNPYSLQVILGNLPQTSGHPAYHFAGGKSARSDGFKNVFAHDGLLRPEQCGGPVFDSSGNFCGINIARFSRTSALAFPKDEVFRFIEQSLQ